MNAKTCGAKVVKNEVNPSAPAPTAAQANRYPLALPTNPAPIGFDFWECGISGGSGGEIEVTETQSFSLKFAPFE